MASNRSSRRRSRPALSQVDDDAGPSSAPRHTLLTLPWEVLDLVMHNVNASSLAKLSATCKFFRQIDRVARLRLTEKVAKEEMERRCGVDAADRWRRLNWLERLHIEEVTTSFDIARCEKSGFAFGYDPASGLPSSIKLEGMGPKLLVSDASTADQPLLRWRLEIKGNTAVEFGVIPVSLEDQSKSLHKCHTTATNARPVGFCSSITVGSVLPVKVPLMKGSVVEVLARRGRVEFLVCNPQDGQELHWQHTRTVPKPYKGPLQIRSEQDFPADFDVRLAITCWARGAFDVLHSLPPERQMAARPAASSSQSPDSSRSSSGSPESSAPAAAVLPAIVGNNTA